MEITKNEASVCKECSHIFKSGIDKINHLKNKHSLTFEQYIIKHYYNNIKPTCKCGCKTPLAFKSFELGNWFSEYTKNHAPKKPHTEANKKKIKENTIKTIQKKYGVNNVFELPEFQKKAKQTKLKRYNNETYNNIELNKQNQRKTFFKKIIEGNRLPSTIKPNFDITTYNGVSQDYEFTCNKCNTTFLDSLDDGNIPSCPKCIPFIKSSVGENELYDFIHTELKEVILKNDRKLLYPKYELDMYIPSKRIAIEYNGLYWHGEKYGKKTKTYHLNKLKECENKNIRLIQIFEDEWYNKQEIIKDKLRHIFSIYKDKIYARNVIIKEISLDDKNTFLKTYHIQGTDASKIKLGAFYKDELVAVMTFGTPRFIKSSNKTQYEMIRFCTSKNIVGMASKFIKYFIKIYNPTSIISYADRRWTDKFNNFYEKCGFKKISDGSPGYWYTKNYLERHHRFSFRKSNLSKKLKKYDSNLSEWQNMQLNGYDRIWDCGNLKYELIII